MADIVLRILYNYMIMGPLATDARIGLSKLAKLL
jgi:hypothetical protein